MMIFIALLSPARRYGDEQPAYGVLRAYVMAIRGLIGFGAA